MVVVVTVFALAVPKIFVDPRDPGFGSRDFPVMVLVVITLLTLAMGLSAFIRLARSGWAVYEPGEVAPVFRYLLPAVVLGFTYVWLLELFQYVLPTFAVLATSLALFGNRGLFRLVLVPLLVTTLFYLLFFGVFGLNEPLGTVLSYENGGYFQPLRAFFGL